MPPTLTTWNQEPGMVHSLLTGAIDGAVSP